MSQSLVPCLWFDSQAVAAAEFYVDLFSKHGFAARKGGSTPYAKATAELVGPPPSEVMTVDFELEGLRFVGLNGGPVFRFTPAISFFVDCGSEAEAQGLFEGLAEGGQVLMPFQAYDFSAAFGWTQDRFGLSWQVNAAAPGQRGVAPFLLFTGAVSGKAEEALRFYAAAIEGSALGEIIRFGEGEEPQVPGSVKQARAVLAGKTCRAMDGGQMHEFGFTEAVSLQVLCDSQAEIDRLWQALGEGGDPDARQCGWLKDRYGVSWQVVPAGLPDLLREGEPEKVEGLTRALLGMRKLDWVALQRAYEDGQ